MISDGAAARVLVLMPMLPGYEAVRQIVATTVADAGLEMVRLDVLLEDWQWLDWLYTSVRQCDFVLADPSKHNPYVMYELGVARANMRPTLVTLDREDTWLSGSLDGSSFLPYSNANLDEFSLRLRADLSILAKVAMRPISQPTNPGEYYSDAVRLLNCFRDEIDEGVEEVEEDAFTVRLSHSISHGTFTAALTGTLLGDVALLAALVRSSRMVSTMIAIRQWLGLRQQN